MLRPDWLSAKVSHKLLNKIQVIPELSLRAICDKLVPPSKIKIPEKKTQSHVQNLDSSLSQSQESNKSIMEVDVIGSPIKIASKRKPIEIDLVSPEVEILNRPKSSLSKGSVIEIDLTESPFKTGGTTPVKGRMNVTSKNKYGETQLHVACRNGNAAKVNAILNTPNVRIDEKDNDGWTALHEACAHGKVDCVRLLLNHKPKTIQNYFAIAKNSDSSKKRMIGVDVLAKGGEDQVTPLHDAIRCGHVEVVRVFLEKLRDHKQVLTSVLEAENTRGQRPTDLAVESSEEMKAVFKQFGIKLGNTVEEKNDDINLSVINEALVLEVANPMKYYVLASNLIAKCSAMFRLHETKELMKVMHKPSATRNDQELLFRMRISRPRRVIPSELTEFPVVQNDITKAQDIRTYWTNITKKSPVDNPGLDMMLDYHFNQLKIA